MQRHHDHRRLADAADCASLTRDRRIVGRIAGASVATFAHQAAE
jgi:hypothetical protein